MREEFSDGRVRLRRYRGEDAQSLFEAAVESVALVGLYLPWCHEGFRIEEAREWIATHPAAWQAGTAYEFLFEDAATGAYVGAGGINAVDKVNLRANLGYWIRSSRMGRGFAPAAALLLARWAFEDVGLRRVEVVVDVRNTRSRRVAEKIGAVREGVARNRLVKGGVSHDAVMYSLIPSDLGLK